MTHLRIPALALAVAAVLALVWTGRPGQAVAGSTATARSLTVAGSGAATAVPDRAAFSFGVTTQAVSATEALRSNATLARKVIAAVKAAGIADADVQTQAVFLAPRPSDDGSVIVGYTATNSVSTTLRDLSKAGAVVDAAVGAGANEVSGPSLTRSDQTSLYRAALRQAVADAKVKAEAIAGASGAVLGAVSSVMESSGGPVPLIARDADAAAEPTPIEPGTQTIEAFVTVEYAVS